MTVNAPFTDQQVMNINNHQKCSYLHPLTCTCGDHISLEVTKDGLVCPNCGKVQTWVYKMIANGEMFI